MGAAAGRARIPAYSGLRSDVNAAPVLRVVFRAESRVRARASSRDLLYSGLHSYPNANPLQLLVCATG
jgi:hypothetical protein